MKFIEFVYNFFDKMEDHVRARLSRHAFIYTFIGGTGIVLFWRGIWHVADVLETIQGVPRVLFSPLGSVILGATILLSTGLFVSVFVGESIIISGIKKDKKVIDRTEEEVASEMGEVERTLVLLVDLKKEVEKLEIKVRDHNKNNKG
ncbi:MAG: hypothetical protein WC444_00885 [Candidatus Paceibacterota bacterium]